MNITDELREYATVSWDPWVASREQLYMMCDRIDAEHEKAMSRAGQLLADAEKDRDCNYANWQECNQKVLQSNITLDELNAKIEHLMDKLTHRIELPKDANDVPWNVGDQDEDCNVVIELRLTSSGWFVITDGELPYRPDRKRHHHAPTVEDVLREFAERITDSQIPGVHPTYEEAITEYAKRLTLAVEVAE